MLENELTRLAELAIEVLAISVASGLGVSLLVRSAGIQMVGLGDLWAFLAVWAIAVAADYYGGQSAVGVIRVLYGTLLGIGILAYIVALANRVRRRRGDQEDVAQTGETPDATDLRMVNTLGATDLGMGKTLDETDLMERIERLERTVEHLKGALQRATPGLQPSRTLEAEQLVLRDAAGNRRAELGVYAEGRAVGLRLFDQAGQTRSELAVNTDGSPILRLCDQAGKVRGGLGVTPDGWPLLALFDQAEKSRAHLSVKSDGSPDLNFRDEAGKRRYEVGLSPQGEPLLALFDQAGEVRSVLGLRSDGSPDLNFRDQAGAVRADMYTASDGSPSLQLFGENREAIFSAP